MKLQFAMIAALAVAAGPAAAQGTFSHGHGAGSTFGSGSATDGAKTKTYGVPSAEPGSPAKTKTYGVPEAPKPPTFEPYKGYSGSSVYSHPSNSRPPGAKPCETSVYVNACGK